jgi:hypothetical protein
MASRPQYTIGYMTGSVGVGQRANLPNRAGSVNVLLFNRGSETQYATAQVLRWTSFPKTEIVWISDDALGVINPGEGQLLEYLTLKFDGTRYWVRILVTSEDLVPSVEFTLDPADLTNDNTAVAYYSPGDLVKFVPLMVAPGGLLGSSIGGEFGR